MLSLAYILVGALVGVFRPSFMKKLEPWSPRVLDALLTLLLFSSSLTFGSDPQVAKSVASLGLVSGVTAFFAVGASAAASFAWHAFAGRRLSLSRTGSPRSETATTLAGPSDSSATVSPDRKPSAYPIAKLAAAIPAIAVGAGWACGIALHSNPMISSQMGAMAKPVSSLSLSALLLVVGYDLGKDRIWVRLREYGLLAATLPLAVGAASILGAGLAARTLSLPLTRGFLAGSGFGWYSLAGAMTLTQKGAEIGAYVFLSNLIREMLALTVVPLLAGKVSPEVAASLGGATSMDSTLPAISRAFGSDGAAWGLITGTVLSLACPFVLGFFLKL